MKLHLHNSVKGNVSRMCTAHCVLLAHQLFLPEFGSLL